MLLEEDIIVLGELLLIICFGIIWGFLVFLNKRGKLWKNKYYLLVMILKKICFVMVRK